MRWGHRTGAILIALCVGIGGAASQDAPQEAPEIEQVPSDTPEDDDETNGGTEGTEEAESETTPVAAPVDLIETPAPAEEDQPRQEGADQEAEGLLAAQWRIAEATIAQAALTGLMVLLLGFTLWFTRRAAIAADGIIAETKRIGEAQVRAYLSITSAKAFIDDKDGIVVDVTVINAGQSPARDVHAIVSVWVNRTFILPEAMGGEIVQSSVEVYSRPVRLGDIQSGDSASSGLFQTHDLSFPTDVVRNKDGTICAGAGNVGVFAQDVFGKELFECDGVLVATGAKQFGDWERHGNFDHRHPLGFFGQSQGMRSRGWKDYEPQDHGLSWES